MEKTVEFCHFQVIIFSWNIGQIVEYLIKKYHIEITELH